MLNNNNNNDDADDDGNFTWILIVVRTTSLLTDQLSRQLSFQAYAASLPEDSSIQASPATSQETPTPLDLRKVS